MVSKELIDIFYVLEDTFIGEDIRSSIWLFPVIERIFLIRSYRLDDKPRILDKVQPLYQIKH